MAPSRRLGAPASAAAAAAGARERRRETTGSWERSRTSKAKRDETTQISIDFMIFHAMVHLGQEIGVLF